MNVSIKIIFDPTTTSMKIPTTSDEDTASLLLSPSVATQSDALPEQLQQWPCKKSKLARSGYESTSAAVMPPTAHRMLHDVTTTTAKANGSRVRNYVGCNEQDGQAFSDQRERRGWQSISWNHQKKAKSRTASSHQQPSFCKFACSPPSLKNSSSS